MRFFLVALVAVLLSACASSNKESVKPNGQYCYTEQEITRSNGKDVSSETVVQCSDKPKVNHVTRSAGVAEQCRSYTHQVVVNGRTKNVKGFLCKFPNGVWEPVNSAFSY